MVDPFGDKSICLIELDGIFRLSFMYCSSIRRPCCAIIANLWEESRVRKHVRFRARFAGVAQHGRRILLLVTAMEAQQVTGKLLRDQLSTKMLKHCLKREIALWLIKAF